RSIAALAISAAAPRFDAIAADPVAGLERCERKPELPFHRARQKSPHAVLLPAGCLHHFLDARSRGLAQQAEHALLLGDVLAPWFFSLRWHLRGGTFLGLRDNRPGRFLGDDRSGRDLAPP